MVSHNNAAGKFRSTGLSKRRLMMYWPNDDIYNIWSIYTVYNAAVSWMLLLRPGRGYIVLLMYAVQACSVLLSPQGE